MDRCAGAAARLPGGDRKDLSIRVLARPETLSDLAARHGMSRMFVYQQTHKARAVLDGAFSPAVPDSEALFELAVTRAWAAPGDRRADADLLRLVSRHRGVPA